MIYYILLLNKQKNLLLRRKSDYHRNIIIAFVSIVLLVTSVILLFGMYSKEDIETFSVFFMPAIVVLDFSFRFFYKKNPGMEIVPYLTLPIPRNALILYLVLSDLLSFWIYGCGLVYGIILYYYGVLTCWTAIMLMLLILMNNYLIVSLRVLIGDYAILIYPICLVFVLMMLLVVDLLNPVLVILIITSVVFFLILAMFCMLRENLYKELNNTSL